MWGNYLSSCTGDILTRSDFSGSQCSGNSTSTSFSSSYQCSRSEYLGYSSWRCLTSSVLSSKREVSSYAEYSCFAGSELVEKEGGEMVAIRYIRTGDRILSSSKQGVLSYSEVVAVPHKSNDIAAVFVAISTAGAELRLTSDHLLLSGPCGGILSLVSAHQVRPGDCVMTRNGPEEVSGIASSRGRGVYTVVVMEEFIVVGGVIASPFAVNHHVAHSFYNVYRSMYSLSRRVGWTSSLGCVFDLFVYIVNSGTTVNLLKF
jgi:Hint module